MKSKYIEQRCVHESTDQQPDAKVSDKLQTVCRSIRTQDKFSMRKKSIHFSNQDVLYKKRDVTICKSKHDSL